jgi:hypothetical protein
MKNKKAVRYAFGSMVLTTISICILYLVCKYNKVERDYAILIELGILVSCISYNLTKLDVYIEKYADVKAFYNVFSFISVCIAIYIYFQNKYVFQFVSGIAFVSVANTLALWIKYIRKEI